jgi:hypothetical protein
VVVVQFFGSSLLSTQGLVSPQNLQQRIIGRVNWTRSARVPFGHAVFRREEPDHRKNKRHGGAFLWGAAAVRFSSRFRIASRKLYFTLLLSQPEVEQESERCTFRQ